MNDKKHNPLVTLSYVVIFIIGAIIGLVAYALISPVKVQYVEISAKSGENVLDFYVDYLQLQGYIVVNQSLSVNDYTRIGDFKEFLWCMEYGNFTECYVDYGLEETSRLFGLRTFRVPKLWFQLDGIYWELRMDD